MNTRNTHSTDQPDVLEHDEGIVEATEDTTEPPERNDTGEHSPDHIEASDEVSEGTDEITVSIGDEKPEDEDNASAPAWVRDLRKNFREVQRKNRELEAKLAQATGGQVSVPTLPSKPKLEDFDYEPDRFEPALAAWIEKKAVYEEHQQRRKSEIESQEVQWKTRLEEYNKAKVALKVRDYDDAEATVMEKFSTDQQGIVVHGSENPALIVYALGKNPKRASDLAKITDPIQFAVAVGRLETQLKVVARKSPPPPTKIVTGTARVSGTVDSALERLRSEAEKTGDYSKVYKHKQEMKKK